MGEENKKEPIWEMFKDVPYQCGVYHDHDILNWDLSCWDQMWCD